MPADRTTNRAGNQPNRRPSARLKRKKKKQMQQRIIAVVILLLAVGLVWTIISIGKRDSVADAAANAVMDEDATKLVANGTVMNNVFLGETNLGGKTLEEVQAFIQGISDEHTQRRVTVQTFSVEYEITAQEVQVSWTNPDVLERVQSYISTGSFVTRYKQQKELNQNPVELQLEYAMNEDAFHARLNEVLSEWEGEAKEPSVLFDGYTFTPVEGEDGVIYDREAISAELTRRFIDETTLSDTSVYELPSEVTKPQYTADIFAGMSATPMGIYTTDELGEEGRRNNIILSTQNMNGRCFMPGEKISTLAMFGEVTVAGGYAEANGYENGQVVRTIGGGVCQTTTTLYNAVILAELEVDYAKPHSMVVGYAQYALDATVDYAGGLDFTFFNSTDYPIYIASYVSGDSVTVAIYGHDTRESNREVRYESVVLSFEDVSPMYNLIPSDEFAPGLDTGIQGSSTSKYRVETDTHPAVTAEAYKCVYVNGELVERTKFRDASYRPSSGTIYHARDCIVQISRKEDGELFLDLCFTNGVRWENTQHAYNVNNGIESPVAVDPEPEEPETTVTEPEETEPVETEPVVTEPEQVE